MNGIGAVQGFLHGAPLVTFLALVVSSADQAAAFYKSFEELSVHTLPDSGSLDDCSLRLQKLLDRDVATSKLAEVPTYSREFAHLAAIGWKQTGGDFEWRCSGSLISDSFVLTAAHCTLDEGKEPTAIRAGDLDLYSPKDDRFAQQIDIAKIFRHPQFNSSSAYHDVALIKLVKPVTVTDFVTPACLYTNDSFSFPKLHATGWDFYSDVSPPIYSVPLNPIGQDRCKFWHRANKEAFRKGINRMLMCAGDEVLTNCPGDTGGPLQIRLLSSSKYTPFVVGVSALGVPCGQTTPGVYAKISHYINWIEDVTGKNYFPQDCVTRHISERESDEALVAPELKGAYNQPHLTGKKESLSVDPTKAQLQIFKEFKCAVGKDGPNVDWICGCTIVAQDFALTSARCVKNVEVDVVNYKNDWKRIDEIIFHPDYDKKTLYNDLALIRLQTDNRNRYDWKAVSCIAGNEDQRQFLSFGIGPYNLNDDGSMDNNGDGTERYLTTTLQLMESANCTQHYKTYGILKEGLNETQFCAWSRDFLVPGTCEPWNGNEVLNELRAASDTSPFPEDLIGVGSYAPDCGFGRPMVATRVIAFREWMNSVIYKTINVNAVSQVLMEKELALDYICEASDREAGVCVNIDHCNHRALVDVIKFCTNETAPIVCCPVNSFIATAHLSLLTECETNYLRYRKKYVEFASPEGRFVDEGQHPHSVMIGWRVNKTATNWHCTGTLINRNTVLTTAGCTNTIKRRSPDVISIGEADVSKVNDGEAQIIPVVDTIRYPSYNPKTHEFDIAILKLESEVVINENAVPACLWRDLNRTPYYTQQVQFDKQLLTARDKNLVHNRDCKQFTSHTELNNDQMCWQEFKLRQDGTDAENCGHRGDPFVSFQRTNNIYLPYLVGLYSFSDSRCASGEPVVATRISSYINWISLYL
ncbi:transmembrane protease serine 9-like [Toxorhynchites rutilus septentrionalis]|uniref:transmembrane protease serine 9-like n=1 Tax=Toxorhynchites rutilus septentrionalis TaxID=329112 RepID=UPI00247B078D|nr:transmembrane protease serine 9-like [Toxorhynchites rutilus septentrionalis]